MVLMSRMPLSAMFSVRGMGVALSVSVSTCFVRSRSFSLWVTPKRCSSSMISSPKSLNSTFLFSSLCVPMSRSTRPSFTRCNISFTCLGLRKRDSTSTVTGNARNRAAAVA